MAKQKSSKKPQSRRKGSTKASPWEAVLQSASRVIAGIVDRFGWPGAIFVLTYVFVERHATASQKQALIDKLLINPELPGGSAWAISTVLFIAIVVFQRVVYKQRDAIKDTEIRRLAEWKTEHQQAALETRDTKLHSTLPKGAKDK